jgi:hypothetical protein
MAWTSEVGGSIILSYIVSKVPTGGGCISDWHLPGPQAIIKAQIQARVNAGQRRFAWPILFYPDGSNPALDSAGGVFARPQERKNLLEMLRYSMSLGVAEHFFEMIPEWTNNWQKWTDSGVYGPNTPTSAGRAGRPQDWQPDALLNCLQFTLAVDRVFQEAGCQYGADLWAELPDPRFPESAEIAKRHWRDFCACADHSSQAMKSGFSHISLPGVWDLLSGIYGDNVPRVPCLHIYEGEGFPGPDGQPDTEACLRGMTDGIRSVGLERDGYVITECFYDDAQTTQAITNAQSWLPVPIWWRTQWSTTRVDSGENTVLPLGGQF